MNPAMPGQPGLGGGGGGQVVQEQRIFMVRVLLDGGALQCKRRARGAWVVDLFADPGGFILLVFRPSAPHTPAVLLVSKNPSGSTEKLPVWDGPSPNLERHGRCSAAPHKRVVQLELDRGFSGAHPAPTQRAPRHFTDRALKLTGGGMKPLVAPQT